MLILERFCYGDNHTAGKLILSNTVLYTMERPWLGNKPFKSCIPPGLYSCKRRYSEKFGHHWILQDVPGRDLILIHPGNYASELEGCIAPGLSYTYDYHRKCSMVTHSRDAMKVLEKELLGIDKFDLNITSFIPEYP